MKRMSKTNAVLAAGTLCAMLVLAGCGGKKNKLTQYQKEAMEAWKAAVEKPGADDAKNTEPSEPPVETKFVTAPAGSFMSSLDVGYFVAPFSVTLTRPFAICDHEVTQGEYKSVVGGLPNSHQDAGTNYPVNVNWYQAILYCNKLSIKEGLTPCYTVEGVTDWANLSDLYKGEFNSDGAWDDVVCDFDADGYRLPTAAEMEYAARAGETDVGRNVWSGTTDESSMGDYVWYEDNSGGTLHEVKGKKPNAWGLYDMNGNASEWVWDWAANDGEWYDVYKGGTTDPVGPSTEYRHELVEKQPMFAPKNRLVFGGSFASRSHKSRIGIKEFESPSGRGGYGEIGFRVCRTIK